MLLLGHTKVCFVWRSMGGLPPALVSSLSPVPLWVPGGAVGITWQADLVQSSW